MTSLATESSAHLYGTSFLSVLLKEHQISWEAVVIQRAFPDLSPCPFTAVFRHRIYPLSIVSVLHSIFFAGCQHTHTHTRTHTLPDPYHPPRWQRLNLCGMLFFFFLLPLVLRFFTRNWCNHKTLEGTCKALIQCFFIDGEIQRG